VYRRFGGTYCHITRAVLVEPSPTLKMDAARSTEASAGQCLHVIPGDNTRLNISLTAVKLSLYVYLNG
jgi:hypothetical protein